MSPTTHAAAPARTSTAKTAPAALGPLDTFAGRHLGPSETEVAEMLAIVGCSEIDQLIAEAIPAAIRMRGRLRLEAAPGDVAAPDAERGEAELLAGLRGIAQRNEVFRSYIGMGYHDCLSPAVIVRNILENPCWYTQYTPYQAEIAQGRLEALLNYQTMICELTGLPVANASLLDEGTAAAEAMSMALGTQPGRKAFFVAEECHPQTIAVVETRASGLGIEVRIGPAERLAVRSDLGELCGALVQYPATDGTIREFSAAAAAVRGAGGVFVMAADPLALTLLVPPGEIGADIAVGSTQRFGIPMGLGGPHAAYLATRETFVRKMPGRLIGVSRDNAGQPALRMAIQTREQHIRRDRATSNICTAQVLLAVMAGFYGVYHGPEGLVAIATRVRTLTGALAAGLRRLGHRVDEGAFFDAIRVHPARDAAAIHAAATARRMNFRSYGDGSIGVALDETTTPADLAEIWQCFGAAPGAAADLPEAAGPEALDAAALAEGVPPLPEALRRRGAFMQQAVFHRHRSETELLRYITRLQSRDLSLAHSMIPLGSCTMKLNATSEMLPVSWPEFAGIHPFAPPAQWQGYAELFRLLEGWLCEITGFPAVSLQPNAGSQGEYAGLMVIRAYHHHRGEPHRDACLIPVSAHGTNPASAVVAGMQVVPVACDDEGNIDLADLRRKAEAHRDRLAACMVTYPSTHGVFEEEIRELCELVHAHGGLVYMDGANMNAQVGLTRPAEIGADVCHLNLHKTFCIPHGGGGPGMGPIGVTEALAEFLPGHPVVRPASAGRHAIGPISAAPYGSALILTIPWVYIALMGEAGLRRSTEIAILNANYMAKRLEGHYPILYANGHGRVAHEFIVDCRGFDRTAGIKIDDIAKRLMDYGFHAPTMAWPVPGTLMIEPTESEGRGELDRFCDAMIAIREEIRAIEEGRSDREDNPLRNAPHPIAKVCGDAWPHGYSREQAAFPLPWLRQSKFWPAVGRVDNPYGDRNLVCTCDAVEAYA